jgi:hypothetical protein
MLDKAASSAVAIKAAAETQALPYHSDKAVGH